MNISAKLIAGFLIISLLVGAVGYVGLKEVNIIGESFEEVTEEAAPVLMSLIQIKQGFQVMLKEILSYAITGDEEDKEEFKKGLMAYREHKNEVIKREGAEGGNWQELIGELEEAEARITEMFNEIVELKDSGGLEGTDLAELFQIQELEEFEHSLEEILEERIEHEQEELEEQQETVVIVSREAQRNILAFSIFAVLLGIGVAFFISRSITKPITKLKDSAKDISRGHMGTKIEIKGNDEISELAKSFDDMRYTLKMIIEEYEKQKKSVKESEKGLEKKVNQRTKQLQMTINKLNRKSEDTAKRLRGLIPVLQKVALGDFSSKLQLPEKEDEFTELIVGLNLMIEDLRESAGDKKSGGKTKIRK